MFWLARLASLALGVIVVLGWWVASLERLAASAPASHGTLPALCATLVDHTDGVLTAAWDGETEEEEEEDDEARDPLDEEGLLSASLDLARSFESAHARRPRGTLGAHEAPALGVLHRPPEA